MFVNIIQSLRANRRTSLDSTKRLFDEGTSQRKDNATKGRFNEGTIQRREHRNFLSRTAKSQKHNAENCVTRKEQSEISSRFFQILGSQGPSERSKIYPKSVQNGPPGLQKGPLAGTKKNGEGSGSGPGAKKFEK